MGIDDATTEALLRHVADGDQEALEELLAGHRARLRQMVAVRLDPRLAVRVDASDVVQEALMEVSRRFSAYVRSRELRLPPSAERRPLALLSTEGKTENPEFFHSVANLGLQEGGVQHEPLTVKASIRLSA